MHKGDAKQIIANYSITPENYTVVIDQLKREFDDLILIAEKLLKKFFAQENKIENTVQSLQKQVFFITRSCRQLENIDKSYKPSGPWLAFWIYNNMSAYLKTQHNILTDPKDRHNMPMMLDFL
jgi:Protein of unknown function (DUF1759)